MNELSQMLCRFHPMPTPPSILAAAAAAGASGSVSSVSDVIEDGGFPPDNRLQNFPSNRLVRRQDARRLISDDEL